MNIESVINIWPKIWPASPDFSPLMSRNTKVRKIVIGGLPTGSSAAPCLEIDDELPAFDIDFPNLTHLYVWSTTVLLSIPSLPASMQVLEVRRSLELSQIEMLPANLESLVIADCEKLQQLPNLSGQRFEKLHELSLAGCVKVPADWIRQLINAAPHLQSLDLLGCSQIDKLPVRLPTRLDRLELNNCTALTNLPDPLPLHLRRLGLKGASTIQQLPTLPKHIAYLDLQLTESLSILPPLPERDVKTDEQLSVDGIVRGANPRTLFLYGSGVLEPPASEHGASLDTNVATETREYFDDLSLVGPGTVRRSKLLFLGNGSAGKTRLALNLNPHYINQPIEQGGHYRGSTHGIQFWDWTDFEAKSSSDQKPVHLHMWDFGGQEIYHATHRNFIRQGSVFILLWNPEQDGRQPDQPEDDVWYPLRYWLDLIQLECPHRHPLRAIVCTHQGSEWRNVKERRQRELRNLIGDEDADRIPLFMLDSASGDGIGERGPLLDWLQAAVYKLVAAQGTVVPTHWEIAQNMVEPWLPKPNLTTAPIAHAHGTTKPVEPAAYKTLSQTEFRSELHSVIQQQTNSNDTYTDFTKLRKNYANGKFLTERRLHRTLRFLTHSGWLYWKEDLEDGRVIVDQRWALDVAYEILQRKNSSIRRKLIAAGGKFSFHDLQERWDGTLEAPNQPLILSFMTSIGVCFPLSRHWHNHTSDTQIYISPTHLPPSAQLCDDFDRQHNNCVEVSVASSKLHRGHWFTMLREVCRNYGELATYTRDACLIAHATHPADRQSCSSLMRFKLDDETAGMGGNILIRVAGDDAGDVLDSHKRFVEAYLPGGTGNASVGSLLINASDNTLNPAMRLQESETGEPNMSISNARLPKARVFISHSSVDKPFVRQLVADLKKQDIPVWFDESDILVGDSIVQKINTALSESDYLIVVLSQASIESAWVKNELDYALMEEKSQESIVILPVKIDNCEVPPLLRSRLYADFSKNYATGLKSLERVFSQEKLHVVEKIRTATKLTTCEQSLASLSKADLRRRLKRMSRDELAVVWYDLFESRMNDDMVGRTHSECLLELLLRADSRRKTDKLIESVCSEREDLGQDP